MAFSELAESFGALHIVHSSLFFYKQMCSVNTGELDRIYHTNQLHSTSQAVQRTCAHINVSNYETYNTVLLPLYGVSRRTCSG